MDNRRVLLFVAITVVILTLWQVLGPKPAPRPTPPAPNLAATEPASPAGHGPAAPVASSADATPAPRVPIDGPRVVGSMSLRGARIDDLSLRDYHDTVDKQSPLVRLLAKSGEREPSSIQFGWLAEGGAKVPDDSTVWTAEGAAIAPGKPVVLHWDNGAGLVFSIALTVDDNYVFTAVQSVKNTGSAGVKLYPWQRVRRDYQPQTAGYSVLFEGLIGVENTEGRDRLEDITYKTAANDAAKHDGVARDHSGPGGWAGFTDKYWLTALVPDQASTVRSSWNHWSDTSDHYQVSFTTAAPQTVEPGAEQHFASRAFIGAKEVRLLDHYETSGGIPMLSYAVDWGHLFFLTKPIFYALDWLNGLVGNFGVAILIFTIGVKALFFPLASRAYRSMGKMRLLQPKITALRERFRDDPARQQQEMLRLYKEERVNPASGCLPMLVQIPVFFSLYKVILITIEMRHAPFFGWVRDLSATDPTNLFNLFGVLPFDPAQFAPALHLGVWPLILGVTMYLQQRLNPPPPDPVQARMFQFMPILFTFMMARFPAGLVIYYSWNNTLTIIQQWLIQRNAKLGPARPAKA